METVLSKEVQAGLDRARSESMGKASRLRVSAAGRTYPVLNLWKSGFSMASDAPALRGRVDLHDGSVHLFHCLIVKSEDDADERRYEFKRATAVAEKPALDFELPEHRPAGLIEDTR